MPDDFFEAIETVFVEQFSYVWAGALVLHARLDQVDRVDGRGARGTGDRPQGEAVGRLQEPHHPTSLLWTLKNQNSIIMFWQIKDSKKAQISKRTQKIPPQKVMWQTSADLDKNLDTL